MKKFKALVAVVLLCTICFSLCSCGINKEEAIGTWSSTYVYNGNDIAVTFTLRDDGSYSYRLFKNGVLNTIESGTYDVKSTKIVLNINGNTGSTRTYKVKGDALVNNNHKFYKTSLDMSLYSY
ncbi:MAG: hypothetical protein J6R20_01905 [Clostridia bacterium]|nr:hypothetical protein [Clostridia bacterium]